MKEYSYTINIAAKKEEEAHEKMKALIILASKLNSTELSKLAHVIKHDPVKTALAKKYLGV
jgi:hypothetical protein